MGDDAEICHFCDGSGEGALSGSTCRACRGSGELRDEDDDYWLDEDDLNEP